MRVILKDAEGNELSVHSMNLYDYLGLMNLQSESTVEAKTETWNIIR